MIVRLLKNKNFSVISNIGINDEKLSLKAKGMYAFLLSKPDEWKITSRGLESVLKESRPTIVDVLRELEEAGYLKRTRKSLANGKFRWEATLYEQAMDKELDHGGSTPDATDEPTMDKKTMDGKLVHIVNTDKVNTNKYTDEEKAQALELHKGFVKLFKLDHDNLQFLTDDERAQAFDTALKGYKLTDKRMSKTVARLRDAGFDMCKKAIGNMDKSPWHHGDNPNNWKADLYEFLFRNYEQVEKWATK